MHPDRGAVHDRIEKHPAQIGISHNPGPYSARQGPCPFRATRSEANDCPGVCQGESGGSRRASRSNQQNTTPRKVYAAFEAAQNSDVIRIVPVETPSATHDYCIDRPNALGQGIAFIEMPEDFLLVRYRDRESGNPESFDGTQEISQIPDEKRHKNRIVFARVKCCIVQHRRERMANRIADHAVDARPLRNLSGSIKLLHRFQGKLARCRGLFNRGISKGTTRPQRKNAPCQTSLAHGNGHDIAAALGEFANTDAIGEGLAIARNFRDLSSSAKKAPGKIRKISRCPSKIVVRQH
jgi:hypothetical protein